MGPGRPKGRVGLRRRLSRRVFLRSGIAAGAALYLPACADDRAPGEGRADAGGAAPPASRAGSNGDFTVALPIPPVLAPVRSHDTTDYYAVEIREGTTQLRPGAATRIWGYDGIWPGPTIRAQRGRAVEITYTNRIPERVSVHLHGANSTAESDGHPADYFEPGESKTYRYANDMPAAPLWYHDHAVDLTGKHVAMGLAGMYLLTDDVEQGLALPSGDHHVPLVLQDRVLDADNQLVYAVDREVVEKGFLGDVYCVNGAIVPRFDVATVKYRFTILNGSNARTYRLELSNGATMTVIGSDGGLLPEPVDLQRLEMAPAERFDVVVDFAAYPVGTSIVLRDADWDTGSNVMRFDVTRSEVDTSTVPSVLRPMTRHDPATANVCRSFSLGRDSDDDWVINGLGFDAARVDARPELGGLEIWEFDNQSREMHPMHVHLVQFQVMDIDGAPPPPELAGWKDTVRVPSGDRVRVIARFEGHTGLYVFHCHILEHEDHHMMAQMEVVPAGAGDAGACSGDAGGGWTR